MIEKPEHTDEELLKAMGQGSEHAFSMLYEKYWDRLFVKAFRVIGKKEEAEDMVQNVFFAIWKRREELKIEGSLPAYLDTSIRYMAIRYIEKNITSREYLALLTEMGLRILPPHAELHVHFKQAQEIINKVVETMSPKMQAVYRLSREEYLTHNEIATRLDISHDTVKKHIQNALKLIKAALAAWLIEFHQLLNQYL